ncbi:UbiA family prenyltransferase, partial [Acinetobacter baumannii]
KNVFVLAPLAFSGRVDDPDAVLRALVVFAAFCLVSSAGYAYNDVRDAELDRAHPLKKRRPVAAGEVAPRTALALAGAGL